ncbi:DUF5590 domain-containing protein [Cohnella candidum]|uniref:Cell wall elongation regulator TseB-like domain-containing protein n=1 Tax=Cohnella candidum TaxID=2674991 RepID=A0A3G3JWR9_9BACL|nr:DUF5590 domain-containing protein [Cohnella candidum]AYQ72678.1 hypothetical protein EAV92_08955 [Cohnella candidum]
MSLSRTESRRRLTSLSMGKWVAAGIVFVALLVLAFVLYVRTADSSYRADERRAVTIAKVQGGLTDIDQAVWYTWDDSLWIVSGQDKDGQSWILWERSDGIVKEKASDGYTESRIRERFAADRPAAVPLRVQPGWFGGMPAWEIRYRKSPASDQQGIDFYSFKEGALLKAYDLPGN